MGLTVCMASAASSSSRARENRRCESACLPCAHAWRRSVEAAQGEQANDWRCSDRGERRPLRPILLLAGPRSPVRSIACLSRTRPTACMHAIEICDTTSIAAKKRFVCTRDAL